MEIDFFLNEEKYIQDLFRKKGKRRKGMEAEDKIALSQKEDKEKKFKDYEMVITKNFKNTMQIFKRNVKEINWEKQTKLIYLVTIDES